MSTATTALTSGKDLDPALAQAIRAHYAELCFNDILTEKTQIRFVQAGERLGWAKGRIDSMHAQTAAWTYIQPQSAGNAERGGYHMILLGDQFASAMRPELRSQEDCRLAFARLLLDHEAMHAKHTERNPHIVARAAKQSGITHLDFNLGEDIRIEELGRKEFARPFAWIRYQDPPEHPASMAQVALYAAYHAESASSAVLDVIRKDGGSLRQADLVGEYFYLLAHAKNSVDVPPLVAGFLSKWSGATAPPATPPPSSSGAAGQEGAGGTGNGGAGASPSPESSVSTGSESPASGGSAAAGSPPGSPAPQPGSATPDPSPASSPTSPSEREASPALSSHGSASGSHADAQASATPQEAMSQPAGDPGAEAASAAAGPSTAGISGDAPEHEAGSAPTGTLMGAADVLQGQKSGHEQDQEGTTGEDPGSSAQPTGASPAVAGLPTEGSGSNEDQEGHEGNAAKDTSGTTWDDIGSSDLWLQEALAAEPSLLDDLLATTTDVIEPPSAQEIADQAGNIGLHIDLAFTTSSDILVPMAVADELGTTLDQNRIRACVRVLRQALGDRQEIVHRDSAPGRLNYRRAANEEDRPFGRKLPGNDCGPTEVVMVIDCSSSMSGGGGGPGAGSPIAEARHLAAAFSVLARERKVAGHIVLSMVGQSSDGRNGAICQTVALPMPERDIRRIEAYGGGEGLAATLTTIQPLARKSDMTFLYTDGNITDQAIDKEALHKQGIYTYGVYVGDIERCAPLSRYVDQAIQGNQLDVAVSRLVTILKAHRTRRSH